MMAMRTIASRSSITARDSSRTRTPEGSTEPARARTPSANAMSVAIGIAQAPSSAAAPPDTAKATRAGTIIPPTAAKSGSAAVRQLPDDQFPLELQAGDEEEDGE